jgi:predicted PurR-regulated permease PerM
MTALHSTSAWQRMAPTLAAFVTFVLAVACLYWARPVLIPVAVALLLTFMLGPAVALLQRRGVPRTPAVLIVVTLAGVVLASALWMVGSQVAQLVTELPSYQENVAKRVAEVREGGSGALLRDLQRFVHEVAAAASGPAQKPREVEADQAVTVRVVERAAASSIVTWLRGVQPVAEPILTTGLIIVLVVYLLIFRDDLRSRILALVGRGQLTLTTKALEDADRRISRYLLAQFTLNVAFGIVIGLGLLAIRVPHALLWGFTAGLLRYIPYLGAWIACSLPIGMSLLVSDGWTQPLLVVGLFIVVEFFANLVVEPWLYGSSVGVSQAAWMIAIIFWTWLWGPVGLMLATPLTTCLVVMGKHVPGLRFFDILLGDDPVLTADVSLYQRLLARDEDGAAEILHRHALTMSPVQLCDELLVPTLVHARHDLRAELLRRDEYEVLLSAVQSIAERQDFAVASASDDENGGQNESPVLVVLACGAQDGAEATALELFQQLLDPRRFQVELLSPKRLAVEVMELVQQRRAAAVLIAALPAGGLSHTCHLCKRLKSRNPEGKILVGRWGAKAQFDNRDQWLSCGADYVATTMAETLDQLEMLVPPAVPAKKEDTPAPPHFSSLTAGTLAGSKPAPGAS